MKISAVIDCIERLAPRSLQEDFDNTGLQTGTSGNECTGVLLCVDPTPEVVAEAVARGCNLIISHHPLFFKGIKRLTGSTQVERTAIAAISAGIAIYSCHTSVDNTTRGVSWEMARMLGVKVSSTLEPRNAGMIKLSVMVPESHADDVRIALFDAGAGRMGNYDCCSYNTDGTGTFRALQGADPYVGELLTLHREPEVRIDTVMPAAIRSRVEQALLQVHPYEVPAYEFISLDNMSSTTGSGIIGSLERPMSAEELVEHVKTTFGSPVARCSRLPQGYISQVAMCGGSGGFLIPNAVAAGAQAMITSDTRYHDFVDYSGQILLIDIGHYESERCTKEIFLRTITEIFPNFAVYYSATEQNPINYL
ncbi:MAG: Nif3-like dinuclear metal center hexameric protein [Muribaculaceae bacterium]|nr:Nif3-like dinuclear metal center hexameric protein [Muribaculaceae bacterium]